MSDERLFLDTVFIQALLNKRDQYHTQARRFLPRVRAAADVWVLSIAKAQCNLSNSVTYDTTNLQVVMVDTPMLARALHLI